MVLQNNPNFPGKTIINLYNFFDGLEEIHGKHRLYFHLENPLFYQLQGKRMPQHSLSNL